MLRLTNPAHIAPLQHSGPQTTRLRRRLAAVAAPALLAGALLASTLAPRLAQAQTAVQRAAVLDFSTGTGLDPILGRKAADALAVELTRSGDYDIVTRQDLEAAVATQPGLRPPFNEATQARLAGVLNARSVFSGRVLRTIVNNNRSARVVIEVRQLDALTGDYINGTQISEVTDEKLQQFDNDVLVDESINKAAFAAVRSMKQTTLPTGTVLNVANEDIQLNIGTRNGTAQGQIYTVLRDELNKARNIVERLKVAEVKITSAEDNQSTARVYRGGQAGVRTGDKVRQIFVPSNFPISATGTSSSPVTAPPPSNRRHKGFLGGIGAGLVGVAALVGLVALTGFGGGTNNTAAQAPRSVVARPVQTSATATDAITGGTIGGSAIQVNFRDGLPGIITGQQVAGYLIFRSTSSNFGAGTGTLIDFARGGQTSYIDDTNVLGTRTITITGGTTSAINVTETAGAAAANAITQAANTVTIVATRPPLQPGVQYFYRVARVLGTRTAATNNTATTLQPVLSQTSAPSGGATALPTLIIDPATAPTSLRNFVVRLPVTFVGNNIDQARLEVSVNPSFPTASTFVQIFRNPTNTAGTPGTPGTPAVPGTGGNPGTPAVPGIPGTPGELVLDANSIIVPGYDPASGAPLYARVGLSASTDTPGGIVFSRTIALNNVTTATSALIGGRFVSPTGAGRRRGGQGAPGAAGGFGGFGTGRAPGFILRHR